MCQKKQRSPLISSGISMRTAEQLFRQKPCEQSLLLSSSWSNRRKGGSAWMASNLWTRRSPSFWTCESCLNSSNWLFVWEHSFTDKPSPLYHAHDVQAWVPNYILATCRACSTKILLDSSRVFLEYAKNWASKRKDSAARVAGMRTILTSGCFEARFHKRNHNFNFKLQLVNFIGKFISTAAVLA